MKRVYIACLMMVLIIGISIFSERKVQAVHDQLLDNIEAVKLALLEDNQQQLEAAVEHLIESWKKDEKTLTHLVRHQQIDEITMSASRLPALAEYRNDSELVAELLSMEWQMRHVLQSEQLSLGALLYAPF